MLRLRDNKTFFTLDIQTQTLVFK